MANGLSMTDSLLPQSTGLQRTLEREEPELR
jgi:hypothetical protein